LKHADVVRAGLPGQLGAEIDPLRRIAFVEPDPAAEERNEIVATGAREIEEEGSIEEEIALFGKQ
jgi:hypothetical protein